MQFTLIEIHLLIQKVWIQACQGVDTGLPGGGYRPARGGYSPARGGYSPGEFRAHHAVSG